MRKKVSIILFAGLMLFACQLPSKLAENFRKNQSTLIPEPTLTPTSAGKRPFLVTSTSIQALITGTSEAYPPSAGTAEPIVPSASTAYPELPATEQAYPSQPEFPTLTPDNSAATLAVDSSGYPQAPSFITPPYPGNELFQPNDYPYPGASESPPSPYNPYPEASESPPPASESPSPQLTVTRTPNTPGTSAIPTRTFGAPESTQTLPSSSNSQPSATRTRQPTATPSPTFFFPTATPTPTRTPYLTPTPTLTFTPTATRTPLPYPPWMSVQITASDPGAVRLAAGKPQLVEFFAYWNGPSLAMAPIIKGIENEYAGNVNFVFLDIDNPATASLKRTLHFKAEPQFILLDPQGKVIKEWVGYVTVEQLRQAIQAVLD